MSAPRKNPNSNRKVRSWNKMQQEEYETIKLLLAAGLSVGMVADIQKRAYNTVYYISKSNSLEDYRDTVTARAAEIKAKAEAKRNGSKPESQPESQPKPQLETEPVADKPSKEEVAVKGRTYFSEDSVNLERIASAMERLADAWERPDARERQPEKKGLFSR